MADNSQVEVDVEHIAKLARLELSAAEQEQFQQEINAIVGYVKHLQEVDVEGIEPTAHATHISNVVRSDEPGACQDRAQTINNAPETVDEAMIKVHVVIGGDAGGMC